MGRQGRRVRFDKGRPRFAVGLGAVVVVALGAAVVAFGNVGSTKRVQVSIPAFETSDLTATPKDDWITQQGNLAGNRYSGLTDISESNVTGLKQAWHVTLKTSVSEPANGLPGEAPQVEYKGTLFAEDAVGRVYARNASTGAPIWVYEPHNPKVPIPKSQQEGNNALHFKVIGPTSATRGVAINDGTVYAEEPAGKLVALDASSGKETWATQMGNPAHGLSLSAAPVYYDGMILGATSGGDSGSACFAFALDAKTGQVLWKFGVIPAKPGDPGYDSWTHPLPFVGGGAIWNTATVDEKNDLVYFGTGNPIPYPGLLRGPGKDEFTDGVIALHAKTGKLAWFFQEVHHDLWDADQSQQPMLATVNYQGQKQDAIISADKDGLWYVLNADTGKPIIPVKETKVQQSKEAHTYATEPIPATDPLIPVTVPNRAKWKKLVAPNGKPYNIGPPGVAGMFVAVDSKRYSVTAAGPGQGASGNKPASYDPSTGLMIEETTPGFTSLQAVPASEVAKISYFNIGAVFGYKFGSLKGTPASASGTRLEAIDPSTGKLVWKVDRLTPTNFKLIAKATPFEGGVLVSNGIIWANAGKHLQALSEKTGKLLWSSPELKGSPLSPPTTYKADGKQYVTTFIAATGDLYAFVLP